MAGPPGRARCCGREIPFRYLLVEWLAAGLFLACWLLFPAPRAVCGWIFLSGLVGAAFIDIDHLVIPDVLSLGLGIVGVALSFLVPSLHGQHALPLQPKEPDLSDVKKSNTYRTGITAEAKCLKNTPTKHLKAWKSPTIL